MSEKIKVPKFLAGFYELFIKEYHMSKIASKLETNYNLSKLSGFRGEMIKDEIFEYIKENGFESTIETLWAMHLNGYEIEDEVKKYKIVLDFFFNYTGKRIDYVFWDADGEWLTRPEYFFIEDEKYRKTFTMEEIIKNFPALVDNAVKVN